MKAFLILAATVSLTVTAHAMPGLKQLMQTVQKREVAKVQAAATTKTKPNFMGPETCTDFTGSWKGQCNMISPEGDSVYPVSFKIEQEGCESLTFIMAENEVVSWGLGSLQTSSSASTLFGSTLITSTDWNADATEIVSAAHGIMKATFPGGPIIPIEAAGRTRKENEKLHSYFDAGDTKHICELDLILI